MLELALKLGTKDWVRIAEGMNRTRTQCRNRFLVIINAYNKNEANFSLKNIPTSTVQKRRQTEKQARFDEELKDFLARHKTAVGENHESEEEVYRITLGNVSIIYDLYVH